jgi:predicted PurR-regulated permease PerM
LEDRSITVRISTRSFVIGLTLVLGAAAVVWLENVVVVMVLAVMLATALSPAVAYFETRLRLSRGPAVAVVFMLLLGVLMLFCMVVIPTLIDQARALSANLPSYGDKLRGTYTWLRIFDARFTWLPDFNIVREGLQMRISGWAESGLGFAGKVFGTLFMVFIVLISAFYALIDAPRLKRGFLRLIPHEQRDLWGAQLDPIGLKIGAYVRGVLTSITVLVVYLAITLSLAGVPLSLVLALMAGCFEIIPTLGPVLGAIPAIVVALTVSPNLAVVVFAIFAFGVFVQSNFVAPMLYSREVELPPLLITVALLIGGELMGVLGAMIAVPVLAVLVVLLENLYLIPREAALRPANPETN